MQAARQARDIAAAKPPEAETPARSVEQIVAGYVPAPAGTRPADNGEAEKVERVVKAFAQANVPTLYERARLGKVMAVPEDVRDAYGDVAATLATVRTGPRPAIYALCGEIGAGKTHMGCALVNDFCGAGESARYVKAMDYVRDLRSKWDESRAGGEAAFELTHVRFKLLVIDEWQVRNDTANENLLLLRLIDKRYEAKAVTLLISNHASQEEFEHSVDARICDRMCDGGMFIPCNWSSLRGRTLKTEPQP